MEQKLKALVAEILAISIEEITDNLSPENNGNWDSLNHMTIITAVEKEFEIMMTMNDIQEIKNFGALRTAIERLTK